MLSGVKEIRDVISEGVNIRKGKRVVRLTEVTVMFRETPS